MKTILLLSLFCLSVPAFCQVDTLIKMNGERLFVNVSEINDESIKFSYPNESFTNSIGKSAVLEIRFKSGRKQEFSASSNVMRVKSCLEWENVQISKIEAEVKGLEKIDIVGAKAKGMTTMSSLGKLQERTYNKIKTETAMLGGNVAFIVEQNTEEGQSGYYSSKAPSVTVSAIAYTSKKVFPNEISFGDYNIESIYVLQTNAYEFESIPVIKQELKIKKEDIFSENNFQKIKLNLSAIRDIKEYTIIFADASDLILSGTYSTDKGKKTYYNVMLKK